MIFSELALLLSATESAKQVSVIGTTLVDSKGNGALCLTPLLELNLCAVQKELIRLTLVQNHY